MNNKRSIIYEGKMYVLAQDGITTSTPFNVDEEIAVLKQNKPKPNQEERE